MAGTLTPVANPAPAPARAGFAVARVRAEFPILAPGPDGAPGVAYLDSAATAQKPRAVIERTTRYYETENANVRRGVYRLAALATAAFDDARARAARFVGAASPREIVFTRGTTEAINLVAQSWGQQLRPGDEVLVTAMEHHANIVPWQLACARTGATLRVLPVTDRGDLDLEAAATLVTERTRLVGVVHQSNVLGTVNPVRALADLAHAAGAVVLVDGAQSAQHVPIDVAALGADFFTVSGHKVYGPTGTGVLWGREGLLDAMPPWQGGGDMIAHVSFERSTWADLPAKFEAGTPNVAGVVGLGAALAWLEALDRTGAAHHEARLLERLRVELAGAPGVRLLGDPAERAGAVTFVVDGIHPHDLATVLDEQGVAIRAGHHCAQPLLRRFGVTAAARASVAAYSTDDDVDRLLAGLAAARRLFG